MVRSMSSDERDPTWLVLKKAAMEMVKRGKTTFTRKELIEFAKKYIDPERPISSLDFEIDLTTVNGSSKDKYRDPEKLFLFRVGRGRYTLYDPELHGPLERYLEPSPSMPSRKNVIKSISESLKNRGYSVQEAKKASKPLSPDLVATLNGEKIGVWIVDPAGDQRTQLRTLAFSIGAAIIERPKYDWVMIIAPPDIMASIPPDLREILEKKGIRLALIEEERKYTVKL